MTLPTGAVTYRNGTTVITVAAGQSHSAAWAAVWDGPVQS